MNTNNSQFNNNTGVFLQGQPSFANNGNLPGSFNSKNNQNINVNTIKNNKNQNTDSDNGEIVTYVNSADQNQIPLTSKISEDNKTKKSIKKIKKI